VRLEIFTVMRIHVVVFRIVTPCSDVVGYQPFGQLPLSLGFSDETAWPYKTLLFYHITQKTT